MEYTKHAQYDALVAYANGNQLYIKREGWHPISKPNFLEGSEYKVDNSLSYSLALFRNEEGEFEIKSFPINRTDSSIRKMDGFIAFEKYITVILTPKKHKHYETIMAYAEGRPIQSSVDGIDWKDCTAPHFYDTRVHFRVKKVDYLTVAVYRGEGGKLYTHSYFNLSDDEVKELSKCVNFITFAAESFQIIAT